MKNPLPLLITTLGLTLLIASTMVSADSRHEAGQNRFLKFFDDNGDDTVTYKEFKGASKKQFERIDADKNSTISEEEFTNYIKARRDERQKDIFGRMDTDKNGKISQAEFIKVSEERAKRKFKRLDKNKDGQLTNDELGGRNKKQHPGKKIFQKIDANKDGKVTREESQAEWEKWFQRMDSNGDKTVTVDEIRQERKKSHQ